MDRTIRKMTPEEWDNVLQVNLHGTFYMCRAVLQHMIERGYGRIVNISSVVGEIGNIGQANYSASKAGLFGLTMSLALECANKGITVNSVAPGFIRTEMVEAVPEEALARSSGGSRAAGSARRTRWRGSSSSSSTRVELHHRRRLLDQRRASLTMCETRIRTTSAADG